MENNKITKKPKTYTVNIQVLKEFDLVAKQNALNKSQFLENCMVEYIKKNKK